MAIYHFTTKTIGAAKGKCAVASAAYQSAEKLHDDRLGRSFSYTHKEEVIYKEIMLPDNASEEYKDRQTLWNEVEKVQNRSNSRYARCFEMALPRELSTEQNIELARNYIQENFVDKGMAADWVFHNKEGNPHIHVMCTVRGFTRTGNWAQMEKKVYARDENGDKIPEIDKKTGEQKVRVRPGKGTEKIWKRVTVKANDWNKREQLLEWRKNWADECNKHLPLDQHIDHRSFEERGIERLPSVHEGYAAREIEARGGTSEIIEENRDRKEANEIFDKAESIFFQIQHQPEGFAKRYFELLQEAAHDNERSEREDRHNGGTDEDNRRLQEADRVDAGTTGSIIPEDQGAGGGEYPAEKADREFAGVEPEPAYQEVEWRDMTGSIHRDIVPALPKELAKPLDNELAEEIRECAVSFLVVYTNAGYVADLREFSKAVAYIQENNIESPKDMFLAGLRENRRLSEASNMLSVGEQKVKDHKKLSDHARTCRSTLKVYRQYKEAKNPKLFRERYSSEISRFEASWWQLKETGYKKVPSFSENRAVYH